MRFRKGDIFELRDILNTPKEMVCYNNVKITGIEALYIRLEHLHLCFLSNIRIASFGVGGDSQTRGRTGKAWTVVIK